MNDQVLLAALRDRFAANPQTEAATEPKEQAPLPPRLDRFTEEQQQEIRDAADQHKEHVLDNFTNVKTQVEEKFYEQDFLNPPVPVDSLGRPDRGFAETMKGIVVTVNGKVSMKLSVEARKLYYEEYELRKSCPPGNRPGADENEILAAVQARLNWQPNIRNNRHVH